jgi:hypothetical protein
MSLSLAQLLDQLATAPIGGYHLAGPAAAEPIAYAALALAAAERWDAAQRAADWLRDQQAADGSVGVTADDDAPGWPTSLALLAWHALKEYDAARYADAIERGIAWALDAKGKAAERSEEVGHDSTLVGWSWAANTHSWLEPTAMFVAALRAVGLGESPRSREGVKILVDRLLPEGGANYGNTFVLGQELKAHPQPTGIALWALAREGSTDPRIGKSIDYLLRELELPLGLPSSCHALIGLAAHQVETAKLQPVLDRTTTALKQPASTFELALLTRAALAVEAALTAENGP